MSWVQCRGPDRDLEEEVQRLDAEARAVKDAVSRTRAPAHRPAPCPSKEPVVQAF